MKKIIIGIFLIFYLLESQYVHGMTLTPNQRLFKAIENRNINDVAITIESNANVNFKNSLGETSLHIAVWNDSIDIVRLLIKSEANINSQNKTNLTPLHYAVLRDEQYIAELLIIKGANINAIDKDGKTPLHLAIEIKSLEMVELLISRGANVEINCPISNKTPLDLIYINLEDDEIDIIEPYLRQRSHNKQSCSCIVM